MGLQLPDGVNPVEWTLNALANMGVRPSPNVRDNLMRDWAKYIEAASQSRPAEAEVKPMTPPTTAEPSPGFVTGDHGDEDD